MQHRVRHIPVPPGNAPVALFALLAFKDSTTGVSGGLLVWLVLFLFVMPGRGPSLSLWINSVGSALA